MKCLVYSIIMPPALTNLKPKQFDTLALILFYYYHDGKVALYNRKKIHWSGFPMEVMGNISH